MWFPPNLKTSKLGNNVPYKKNKSIEQREIDLLMKWIISVKSLKLMVRIWSNLIISRWNLKKKKYIIKNNVVIHTYYWIVVVNQMQSVVRVIYKKSLFPKPCSSFSSYYRSIVSICHNLTPVVLSYFWTRSQKKKTKGTYILMQEYRLKISLKKKKVYRYMTFTKNFALEICFLCERRVLLQTRLLFLVKE